MELISDGAGGLGDAGLFLVVEDKRHSARCERRIGYDESKDCSFIATSIYVAFPGPAWQPSVHVASCGGVRTDPSVALHDLRAVFDKARIIGRVS